MTQPLAPKDPRPSPMQNVVTPPQVSPSLKPLHLLSAVLDPKLTECVPKQNKKNTTRIHNIITLLDSFYDILVSFHSDTFFTVTGNSCHANMAVVSEASLPTV